MNKTVKPTVNYEQLAQLRPGETLTVGPIEVKRSGIIIVVRSGSVRRSFEKTHIALDWINRELGNAAAEDKKYKKVTAVIEGADGSKRSFGSEEVAPVKRVKVKEIKVKRTKEVKAAKVAKHKEHKERKQRGKVRRFFDALIYTLVWLLFLVGGAIVFHVHLAPWMPAEIGAGIESAKTFLLALTSDVKIINSAAIGVGALAAMVLLVTTVNLQLHKTKSAKAWGLITNILTLGGAAYLSVVNFESLKLIASDPSRTLITQVAVIGLVIIQLIIVLAVGWKKKEK